MIINSNYHTHSNLCDGNNTLEEMAERAYAMGLKTLGFSGHSHTAYDESYCMSREGTEDYIRRVRALQDKYAGKMRILLGIEQDFGSDEPTSPYDYVIGSIHAIFPKVTELDKAEEEISASFHGFDRSRYFYVDWSLERLKQDVKIFFGNDPYRFAERYFEMEGMLHEVTNCDIVGHFDLITKFIEEEPWIDENNPRYIKACNEALDKLLKDDLIFEINTGAISRGYRTVPYPSSRILERLAEENARVIINSDTHSVDTITHSFDLAMSLVEKYHLNLVEL